MTTVTATTTAAAIQLCLVPRTTIAQIPIALTIERMTILVTRPTGPEKAAINLASLDSLKTGVEGAGVEAAVVLIRSVRSRGRIGDTSGGARFGRPHRVETR